MATTQKNRKGTKSTTSKGRGKSTPRSSQVAHDLHSSLKEADDLGALLDRLEHRVESLFVSSAVPKELAFETLTILRCLVRNEVPNETIERAIALFFDQVWGDAVMFDLVFNLYNKAKLVAFAKGEYEEIPSFSASEAAQSLMELLSWYRRRRASIRFLDEQVEFTNEGALIFDMKILHDREYAGARGCEVSCGLVLVGRPNETVWFKVFLRNKRRFVTVRANWESWGGSAQTFLLTDLSHNDRVAALVPVECSTQRLLIDNISAFIPYASLQLAEGVADLAFEAQLCDSSGRDLVSEKRQETVYLSAGLETETAVPSPHALGIWPRDFVAGHQIKNLKVEIGESPESRQVDEIISVSCDLVVCSHVGIPLSVVYRFTNLQGDLIGSIEESVCDQRGAFYCSRELVPEEIIQHYYRLEAEIPLAVLNIPLDTKELLCQVTLSTAREQILCGTICPCRIDP